MIIVMARIVFAVAEPLGHKEEIDMMGRFFLPVLLGGLLSACSGFSSGTPPMHEVSIGEVRSVPLRTDCDSHLEFGPVKIVDVQYDRGILYLLDQDVGTVFLADTTGCVVRNIARFGEGPGEIGAARYFSARDGGVAVFDVQRRRYTLYEVGRSDLSVSYVATIPEERPCTVRGLLLHGGSLYINCPFVGGHSLHRYDLATGGWESFLPAGTFQRRGIGGGEHVASTVYNEVLALGYRGLSVIYPNRVSPLATLDSVVVFEPHSFLYDSIDNRLRARIDEINQSIAKANDNNAYQFVNYVKSADWRGERLAVLWNGVDYLSLWDGAEQRLLKLRGLNPYEIYISDLAFAPTGLYPLDRFHSQLYFMELE